MKKKLFIYNIEIYQDTPAWNLAQAVKLQDTTRIYSICKLDSALIDFQDPYFGVSLLNWAVYMDKFNSAKVLAESGADPNLQSNGGTSAFIHAAGKYNDSRYLRLLLRFNGDVNAVAKPKNGRVGQKDRTPLIAAAFRSYENVMLLVEAGADIEYRSEQNQSALQSAWLGRKIEIVRYLVIQKKANIDKPLLLLENGKKKQYLHHLLRDFIFKLDSEEFKMKMEVVSYLKDRGYNYWETEVPVHLYKLYPKEYLSVY